MKLYIIRHGQTIWNAQHRLQGISDPPLSEFGTQQAIEIATWFAIDGKPYLICSSDLRRAFNTAEQISLNNNIPLKISRLLRERDLFDMEGMTEQAIKDLRQKNLISTINATVDWEPFPFIESDHSVALRFQRLLKTIPKNKIPILVTHAGVIHSVLRFLGPPDFDYKNFHIPTASIIETLYHEEKIISFQILS